MVVVTATVEVVAVVSGVAPDVATGAPDSAVPQLPSRTELTTIIHRTDVDHGHNLAAHSHSGDDDSLRRREDLDRGRRRVNGRQSGDQLILAGR